MNIKLQKLIFSFTLLFSAFYLSAENKNNELLFIQNAGQIKNIDGNTDHDISYMIRSEGLNIYISKLGIKYQFIKDLNNTSVVIKESNNLKQNFVTQNINMQLLGSNPNAEIIALDKAVYTEYFYTNNQNIKAEAYKKLMVKNIYQGIDWILYSVNGKLKYDYVINPGADYTKIKMKYNDIKDIKILHNKSLWINSAMGNITENAPFTYLENGKTEIKSKFILKNKIISFELKNTSKINFQKEKIVIDPGLEWATYYGGSQSEEGRASVVDSDKNLYVAGLTKSSTNISTTGSYQDAYSGNYDMFLAKFDPDGNRIWGTYYGDGGNDFAQTLAIDADDNLYLGGDTYSDANMTTNNGHQSTFGGDIDGILVKFNKDGVRLWATYYGGSGLDGIQSVTVDKKNNVLITGTTFSNEDIATTGSYRENYIFYYGSPDVYLAKFDSSGTRLWGTYYGGSYEEGAGSVKTDNNNNIYISGYTGSDDSINYKGHQKEFEGFLDAFLAKFDENGDIIWSTYYGGTQYDLIYGMDIDKSNNLYITGYTRSHTNISKNGFQNAKSDMNQYSEAFLSKFSSDGNLIWGTYYGGQYDEYGNAVYIDENENVYMTGLSKSGNNISFNGMYNTNGGTDDAFLVKFDKNGNRKWASYFGGKASLKDNISLSGQDFGYSLCGDKKGHLYMIGTTDSRDRIGHNGYQDTIGGFNDMFIAKFFTDRIYVQNANTTLCLNDDITIDFKQTINMGFGNQIKIEQSDVLGSFANAQLLTTINDSTAKNFTETFTPKGTLKAGDIMRLRFITSFPADTIYMKDTFHFTPSPLNNLQVSPSNSFCEGDTITLQTNFNTNYQYEWYRNDTLLPENTAIITTKKDGKYKVKNTENNCSVMSNEETLISDPLPIKPSINKVGRILLTSVYTSYQWYKDGKEILNATTQNYTVTEDGNYSVKVKNAQGCEIESDVINVSIAGILINHTDLAKAYPVPTKEYINIETTENCVMYLIDMNGKILHIQNIDKGVSVINISNFAAGIYIVKLQNDTQNTDLKIIKE